MTHKSRMFEFVGECWNPIGGVCQYRCVYCWSQGSKGLIRKYGLKKYLKPFHVVEKEMNRTFKPDITVFVSDMVDLFADNVPTYIIEQVLNRIRDFPKTRFLLLTKNPRGYIPFLVYNAIPHNCILGSTVETDRTLFNTSSNYRTYSQISRAPLPLSRLSWMLQIAKANTHHKLFVSMEPILDFNLNNTIYYLERIRPWAVAVGYDNYKWNLPEPPIIKTLRLIKELESMNIKVYRKTIRKAWYEK